MNHQQCVKNEWDQYLEYIWEQYRQEKQRLYSSEMDTVLLKEQLKELKNKWEQRIFDYFSKKI